jgi:hypothetical protein
VSEVTGPPAKRSGASPSSPSLAPAPKRGLLQGVASGLSAVTAALVRLTGKIFGEVRERGGAAVADFRARPEHSRWRAYALGCYGLIVAGSLGAQLYSSNALSAYVRVQPVELPALTQIFVRNDSGKEWKNVKVTLNGIYYYERTELPPGGHILLPVNKFAIYDALNKPTFAPKNISPKQLSIDTAQGHYETELQK